MSEVLLTILNAAHARLRQMFEARAIHVHTYKQLLSCIDIGEEAVAGELRPYGFFCRKDEELFDLHTKPQMEQMDHAIDVVWLALKELLQSSPGILTSISKCVPSRVRAYAGMGISPLQQNFRKITRNLEMVLSYVLVQEHLQCMKSIILIKKQVLDEFMHP